MLAAADWVRAGKEELNRINVFPVPDGDTGTNFALTIGAVAQAVLPLERQPLPVVSKAMSDASVLGAHGNSGLLLSQFLMGVREKLSDIERADTMHVATAMAHGADRLRAALDDPIEGTILTVCHDAARAAQRIASHTTDLVALLQDTLAEARASLERTPTLLSALRAAGVVDAGAKGFVRLLEGITRLIDGQPLESTERSEQPPPSAAAMTTVDVDRDYQYCTEVLVRGPSLPPTIEIRASMRPLGGSIVVLGTEDLVKVHIHTNDPEAIYEIVRRWGSLESTKADDMRVQHEELHGAVASGVAIVIDSSCDLPDAVIDRYGMIVVPMQVMDGERTLLDRVDIRGEQIYAMMRDGTIFTTSQPTPGAFAEALGDAKSHATEVLCLTLSGALSGTYRGAVAAASGGSGITVVDSRTTSLGLGMLALRAAELVQQGTPLPDVVAEIHRVRNQSGLLVTFDTFENVIRSGRVSRARGWLGTLLDVKPILELDRDGSIVPLDRVRGREALIARVLQHLDSRLTPRPSRLRIGIVHADAPATAQTLRSEIEGRYRPYECFVEHATAAIGVHAGPGAWGVFYQVEDEPSGADRNKPQERDL